MTEFEEEAWLDSGQLVTMTNKDIKISRVNLILVVYLIAFVSLAFSFFPIFLASMMTLVTLAIEPRKTRELEISRRKPNKRIWGMDLPVGLPSTLHDSSYPRIC